MFSKEKRYLWKLRHVKGRNDFPRQHHPNILSMWLVVIMEMAIES
jgi:hypothetical protein